MAVLSITQPDENTTYADIARALAGELNASFYVIKSSDLISKWVGSTEKQIAALFEEARKQDLSVIFIDEIDALMPDRTKGDMPSHENRMVNAMLQELDGFETKGGKQTLLFLGATNRPYSIDSAAGTNADGDFQVVLNAAWASQRTRMLKLLR